MVGGFDWPGFLVKLVDRTRNIRNQPRCEMYNIYAGVESVRGREGGKQENNAKRGRGGKEDKGWGIIMSKTERSKSERM